MFSRALVSNADVLEVIAEYACDTVKDACALRTANKGYRRAVDTTVRRLVYEDQVELSPRSGAPRGDEGGVDEPCALVLVAADVVGHKLQTAANAFASNGLWRVVRLVVVAFALDGAKDELHEGDVCGERPVVEADCGIHARPLLVMKKLAVIAGSCHGLFGSAPARLRIALRRCLVVGRVENSSDFNVALAMRDSPWSQMRKLVVSEQTSFCSRGGVVAMLRAVGPQLTALEVRLSVVDREMCGAIAVCSRLTRFDASARTVEGDGEILVDALIATGAPLESVAWSREAVRPEEVARLLERVRTIVDVVADGDRVRALLSHEVRLRVRLR